MLTRHAPDSFTTKINESYGLGQQQLLASHFPDACPGMAFFSLKFDGVEFGKRIQTAKSNIMPIMGITCTRITQPDDKFHWGMPWALCSIMMAVCHKLLEAISYSFQP